MLPVHQLRQLRYFLFAQLPGLTPAQLNEMPLGYRNTIIWNVAHPGAAGQSLCYGRAGLPPAVAGSFATPYLPGTAPAAFVDEAGIQAIEAVSLATLDQLARDVEAGWFVAYAPSVFIQQRYGVAVENINQALDFLLYHEGFHTGYVLALKHLVQAP